MVKDIKQVRPVFTPLKSPQILLVDDEDGVRLVVSRVLKAKGFLVTECANAEQALEVLANRNDFDLLLTDMIMPGMDALPAALSLAQKHGVYMPIIETVNAVVCETIDESEIVRLLMPVD